MRPDGFRHLIGLADAEAQRNRYIPGALTNPTRLGAEIGKLDCLEQNALLVALDLCVTVGPAVTAENLPFFTVAYARQCLTACLEALAANGATGERSRYLEHWRSILNKIGA